MILGPYEKRSCYPELSPRMGAILSDSRDKGLSGDERRALIMKQAYDGWFRANVLEALADARPDIPGDQVELHFAERRAAAHRQGGKPQS
jgi:hypothetical protein